MPPKNKKRQSEVPSDSDDSDFDFEDSPKRTKVDEEENGADHDTPPDFKLEAPMLSGELMFCGATNWDMAGGRKQPPAGVKNRGGRNLFTPHRMAALMGVKIRTVVGGAMACHCFAITDEGVLYSWGRNEKGQLGHGDKKRRDTPTVVDFFEGRNVITAAVGKNHSMVITEDGQCYAFGENTCGQCGTGTTAKEILNPVKVQYKGPPLRRVACGSEFSMMCDIAGNLYSCGHPEYGQLGHNTDGQYFVSASKLAYHFEKVPKRVVVFIEKGFDGTVSPISDPEITDIACGPNHTLALDRKKRVYSWGFGGYCRLGHEKSNDEKVPRAIIQFSQPGKGATMIATGNQHSIAMTEYGCVMFWGQMKSSGDATMYPKPVQDLYGWKVRNVACCNRTNTVIADQSSISWGYPSPPSGELGLGENKKSSSYPEEMKTMANLHVYEISGGFSHTLFIVRNDNEEEQVKIKKIPVYTPMGECK